MGLRTQILGYPRIGEKRELKKAVESYWKGKTTKKQLEETAKSIRKLNWQKQVSAGIDLIPSNDFSYYDHVLDTVCMLGAIPERFKTKRRTFSLSDYFTMARGVSPGAKKGKATQAMEMTKWFNTNYHYIVPEFSRDQEFDFLYKKPLQEFKEAKKMGILTQPVILGPISFLFLGKPINGFNVLYLIDRLLPVYQQILIELKKAGATQIQIEEPILALDLNEEIRTALKDAYYLLHQSVEGLNLFLTSYFDEYRDNLETLLSLPVQTIHLDIFNAGGELDKILDHLPSDKSLSLGVVNGRNIWKNDFKKSLRLLKKSNNKLGPERFIVSSSCSLLFSPVTLAFEDKLDQDVKNWLAFADEKLIEIKQLARLAEMDSFSDDPVYVENSKLMKDKAENSKIHIKAVKDRCAAITPEMTARKSQFSERIVKQQHKLKYPLFPTTTIGSFPQTPEIRKNRAKFRKNEINQKSYTDFLKKELEHIVEFQEKAGIDVLVHGEVERNDMVEYFGEKLEGFAFTQNGWVQSYGSRCVKPPIIYGDVSRPVPMTTEWSTYAQSLTEKPVKGMLTGPVTILQWSFIRNDQPRSETAKQIALAIRDEVSDLEKANIPVIQIDEPALREGLSLRRSNWQEYLDWAVNAFRLASSGVKDETQIHTHMCYSEFNDIIESIAKMDADVISIEASRSKMELLDAFVTFRYPNHIGPGIWDIHSPRVPSVEELADLIKKAAAVIAPEKLWVNPDCGLKTRGWPEVRESIANMIKATEAIRKEYKK